MNQHISTLVFYNNPVNLLQSEMLSDAAVSGKSWHFDLSSCTWCDVMIYRCMCTQFTSTSTGLLKKTNKNKTHLEAETYVAWSLGWPVPLGCVSAGVWAGGLHGDRGVEKRAEEWVIAGENTNPQHWAVPYSLNCSLISNPSTVIQ